MLFSMKHYRQTFLLILGLAMQFSLPVTGQGRLTVEEAVNLALQKHPAVKASALAVRRNEQLLGAARNIPNPDLTFDSPSGVFYTVGVQQTFRFPTVYGRQYQQQQQQVALAQKEQAVTANDLRYRIHTIYAGIQSAEAYQRQWLAQDSVYAQISRAAQRSFDVGTIDKLALLYAQTQAAEVKNQVRAAAFQVSAQKKQLELLTGLSLSSSVLTPLVKLPSPAVDTFLIVQNPAVQAAQQWEAVTQKAIEVERANALPGFMVGYYNQGTREASLGLRWRAGISLPLWAGQYKSRINAAQTEQQMARQYTEVRKQTISLDLQKAQDDLLAAANSVTFYETVALDQADAIISTARRFFESGQTDYTNFLRTTNDAYAIKLRYLDALQNYNQAVIAIHYLTGTL
ncbi:outer membrane efflux protein [Runella slithyformis DSM 19594]|uniref:Outer membrane efflux protein n=2 Tax=Runella TaxID=105 RepID=A0A7U3ZIW4_RUNSL|nr:outer membrane efflux protein [Runella slithyformis DSM 19594]